LRSSYEPELTCLVESLRRSDRRDAHHVWRTLTVAERAAALWAIASERFGDDNAAQDEWRILLRHLAISTNNGFRPSTIRAWSLEQLCAHVARLGALRSVAVIEKVVLEHHHRERISMVQAPLLDRLGVAHRNGVAEGDELESISSRTHDEICSAALDCWRSSQTRDMALYLLALATFYPERWSSLHGILPTVGDELAGIVNSTKPGAEAQQGASRPRREQPADSAHAMFVSENSSHEAPEVDGPIVDARPTVRHDDEGAGDDDDSEDELSESAVVATGRRDVSSEEAVLSPLDEEIIRRIADGLQGILGAPDEATLDRIINELLQLNASRHQSFYHAGFHDAVRERSVRLALPAQNVHRWRWYFAGYIAGLARHGNHNAIVNVFVERDEVRALGDTGRGPSRYAAVHVAKSLVTAGRLAELVTFASPSSIAAIPALAELVLDVGTGLQREQRMADASPVFERLLSAESKQNVLASSFWATVKRRHAHCLRAEGKLEAARRLLEEALNDADEVEQAMVTVDLGLIDAGFGRLAELRLPTTFDAASEMATALDRGEERFRSAEALGVSTSSHAHYVLGMRSLLRRKYAEAEQLLALAVSQFDLERARYEPAQLLRRAHLHVAIARCANIDSDASRLDQAVRDIAEGLSDRRDVPDAFAEEVIAGLSLRDDVSADPLVERLLSGKRDALLDALRGDEKARRSAAVADALASRFRAAHRSQRQRMEDGVSLVRMLLLQGRYDDAAAQLDEIEELSIRSVEGKQFLSLLESDGDSLSSVWEPEEISGVRVRVLESMQRFDEAAELLKSSFWRSLARADEQGRLDACDCLDSLSGYRCVDAPELARLRARLAPAAPDVSLSSGPPRPMRVLVVGGNEVQERYDASIIEHYRSSAPWVSIGFMHTGWSSNWGEKVDEFSRRVESTDAVVLIYLMRTEFGRAVRKRMNGTPWRGCGGKGRESIQRAIDAAIVAAYGSP